MHLPVGMQTDLGRVRCPGHTWTPHACRQWVLGSGEEERRISAPNSICWRTWPAPRQAENSTYVRTCTQCWLCPRRALPSCCAPALHMLPPHRPSYPPCGERSQARGVLGSLEHPYYGKVRLLHGYGAGALFFHLHVYHEVCPVSASPLLSSGVGEDERGSRWELSSIRSRHLSLAFPMGTSLGSGWGSEHTSAQATVAAGGYLHESPVLLQIISANPLLVVG